MTQKRPRPSRIVRGLLLAVFLTLLLLAAPVAGHGVAEEDQDDFRTGGFGIFLYQGAKHMVTGYDHLLFLVGVIFFLYRPKDILVYVSWFTIGHSTTLLLGVLADIQANAFLVDAVIGLSVVYKGFDNIGGFQRTLGKQPDPRKAVLIFGFIHGFGLATKVQELVVRDDFGRLLGNMIAFNIGVEVGQLVALSLILSGLMWWRRHPSYLKHAYLTNTLLMAAGFALFGMQLTGYFLEA